MNNAMFCLSINLTKLNDQVNKKKIGDKKYFYYAEKENGDTEGNVNMQDIYNYINKTMAKKKFKNIEEMINILSYQFKLNVSDNATIPVSFQEPTYKCIHLNLYTYIVGVGSKKLYLEESKLVVDSILCRQMEHRSIIDPWELDDMTKLLEFLSHTKTRKISDSLYIRVDSNKVQIQYNIKPINCISFEFPYDNGSIIPFHIFLNNVSGHPDEKCISGTVDGTNIESLVHIIDLAESYVKC